jgi:hypothetical protein
MKQDKRNIFSCQIVPSDTLSTLPSSQATRRRQRRALSLHSWPRFIWCARSKTGCVLWTFIPQLQAHDIRVEIHKHSHPHVAACVCVCVCVCPPPLASLQPAFSRGQHMPANIVQLWTADSQDRCELCPACVHAYRGCLSPALTNNKQRLMQSVLASHV